MHGSKAIFILVFMQICFLAFTLGVHGEQISQNSLVYVNSASSSTSAIHLSVPEGSSKAFLYDNITIDIITFSNETQTYSVTFSHGNDSFSRSGFLNGTERVNLRVPEGTYQLTVRIGTDTHRFGTVLVKKHLTAADIGAEAGYLKITQSQLDELRNKAGYGVLTGAIIAVPAAYMAAKYRIEQKGEFET